MIPAEQYAEIMRRRDIGEKPSDIAARVGCSLSTAYNVISGKVKDPSCKRADSGISRIPGMDELIERVKMEYLSQSKRQGMLKVCIDTARSRMMRLGQASPALGASIATIYRHVQRAYDAERWDTLFDYKKMKQNFQTILPRLNYDYWRLVGFNDFWVIDGRKSDQWVVHPETGKPVQPQGFYVMELRTRSFLHVAWSLSSFNAHQVMPILLHTAITFGPPRLGVLCDNGMEQVGQDNILAMESFWEDEIIHAYRAQAVPDFTAFFPGAISPVVTSLPRVPTEFGKAALERSFAEVQRRFDAMLARDGYQGGGRQDVIHRTLTRTPHPSKVWNTFERFTARMDWFFRSTQPTDDGLLPYHCIERPRALQSMTEEVGLVPTVGNAVELCMSSHVRRELPAENYFKLAYYSLAKHAGKRVTAMGQVTYQLKGRTISYHCGMLDYTRINHRVDVVPDPNDPTRAGIFEAGSPRFIGVGIDISTRINSGQITVGQGRDIAAKFRRERVAEVRADADAITEKPHEVPEVLGGVAELKTIQFTAPQPLIAPEAMEFDDLTPEAQELLGQH
jgi:lipid-A-disaccharide synthase-like uncharacterized protein